MKYVCLGDSQTFGLGAQTKEKWVHLLHERSADEFVNRGINGDSSGGMLARFHRDVVLEKPDAVLLMGGTNDLIMGCGIGQVKSNMTAMAFTALSAYIRPILVSSIPIDADRVGGQWRILADYHIVNEGVARLAAFYHEFSEAFQIPYIDLNTAFRKASAGKETALYLDGIHPSGEGHRLMADILWETLSD